MSWPNTWACRRRKERFMRRTTIQQLLLFCISFSPHLLLCTLFGPFLPLVTLFFFRFSLFLLFWLPAGKVKVNNDDKHTKKAADGWKFYMHTSHLAPLYVRLCVASVCRSVCRSVECVEIRYFKCWRPKGARMDGCRRPEGAPTG